MNYLMLVCGDDEAVTEAEDTVTGEEVEAWFERVGDERLYGHRLEGPEAARSVRVVDGETLVSDGPFIEAKEYIAGFDLLSCPDLDAAVEAAAAHPCARQHSLELRPFPADMEFGDAAERLVASESGPGQRFMLMITIDGISAGDEVESRLERENRAWGDALIESGALSFGYPLQSVDTATTVRVRGGETVLSDGPFAESKEFLAGFCVLNCADIDEAVAHAASHPLAEFHPIEVRPFPAS